MRLLIVPPSQSVIGSAPDTVDVYVNGVSADRQGPYWHSVVTVNNVPSPVYAEIEVLGVSTPVNPQDPPEYSISTNHVFVAQSPEVFEYDLDGNLTKDGRFNYSWNGENRLICAETRDDLPVEVPRYKVEYAYDFYGRRIQKEVFTQDNGNWALSKSSSFVCDKWNLISEISVSSTPNSSLLTTNSTSYVWGIDLSGTLQGAGGVGGLLAVVRDDGVYAPTYDANGNISEYIVLETGNSQLETGSVVAHYEYSPFGEIIVQSGDLADSFSFRFSTKPYCSILDKIEFELRIYDPVTGSWMSRDPIEEWGGENLYWFVNNSGVNFTDNLGLTLKAEPLYVPPLSFPPTGTSRNAPPVVYPFPPSPRGDNIDEHFKQLKEQLKNDLKTLCPLEETRWWRSQSDPDVCCDPKDCRKKAEEMAEAYIAVLKDAYRARVIPHIGNWSGGLGNLFAGGIQLFSSDQGAFGWNYPQDKSCLVCQGWAAMAESVLCQWDGQGRQIEDPCWVFDKDGTPSGAHTWVFLKVMNDGKPQGLDPWPSGGWVYWSKYLDKYTD